MLDHPVTQKVLATVVAGGFMFIGGASWTLQRTVTIHDQKIQSIEKTQDITITELKEELEKVGSDVSEIKTNVAVLKEHATHVQSTRQPGS